MNRTSFLKRFLFSKTIQQRTDLLPRFHIKKKAAVLIALVERNDELYIIFTKRASHLRHHPNQISFPGGKQDDIDNTLQQTAIRETTEEIGIKPHLIEMIGQLPPLTTNSGFEVFPFIAFIDHRFTLKINPQEVQSVFEVPLRFLLDNKHFYEQHLFFKKKHHVIYCITYQQYMIWGATALISKNLQKMLLLR